MKLSFFPRPLAASAGFIGLRLGLLAVLLYLPAALAFPPAPNHLIYGMVKDQYGTPVMNPNAKVVLVASNGVQIVATVVPGLAIGINYALDVPMDTGVTPDPYTATALFTATPYKLYVVIGSVTNVPIEMTGGIATLGLPAGQTCWNLTLGVDSNGNGLPDAWEKLYLNELGLNLSLSSLKSGNVYGKNGRTLLQEFQLGNHPFDPEDTFNVRLVSHDSTSALLEFTSMTGRSYTVLGSTDLKNWTPLSFTVPSEGSAPPVRSFYYAPDIRTLQIQAIQPVSGSQMRFFKLGLQ